MWRKEGEADIRNKPEFLPIALEKHLTAQEHSNLNRNRRPPPSTRRQTHLKICVIDVLKHQSRGL